MTKTHCASASILIDIDFTDNGEDSLIDQAMEEFQDRISTYNDDLVEIKVTRLETL